MEDVVLVKTWLEAYVPIFMLQIFSTVCVDNPGGMFVPVSAVYAVQSAAVLTMHQS